jgi:hypothetical protein
MHDWVQIVRRHLRFLVVSSPEFADKVTEELANHLEDRYQEHLQAGLAEEAAICRTVDELEHCRGTQFALRLLKENEMTGLTPRVAVPGLLTFVSAMVIAWALDFAHIQPRTFVLANGMALPFPIAWYYLLPICGALGSAVSHRNGGSRFDRMIAALFPAGIFAVVFLLIFVAGWAISLFASDSGWNWAFAVPGLALWLTAYALLSAVALLAGEAIAGLILVRARNPETP